jgi:excisionase family DNA binding protein
MKANTQPTMNTPLLITDIESAALAGISRATWHRLRAAGKLPPAVKMGRSVRWRRADVVGWIEAGCPDARTWEAMQASNGRRLKIG